MDRLNAARPTLRSLAQATKLPHLRLDPVVAHYLDVYPRHFEALRDAPVRLVEIGTYRGGSLEMWRAYFERAELFGIDLFLPREGLDVPGARLFQGDQADPEFLKHFVGATGGRFDIVIDDGGHTMQQQMTSLRLLFPHVRPGGFYVIEDLHTSYWPAYGGSYGGAGTTIEALKRLIDCLHERHVLAVEATPATPFDTSFRATSVPEPFPGASTAVEAMHLYGSLVLIQKRGEP